MALIRTDKILDKNGNVLQTILDAIPESKIENRAPTINDDSNAGILPFSHWINTSSTPQELYICYSNAVGGAIWLQIQLEGSRLINYKGTWDASTNTPTLANGTGTAGDFYICSVAGTVDFGSGNIPFIVGDLCFYNGAIWENAGNGVAEFLPAEVYNLASLAANQTAVLPITWAIPRPNADYSIFLSQENDQNVEIDKQVVAGSITDTGASIKFTNKSVFDVTNIKLSAWAQNNI